MLRPSDDEPRALRDFKAFLMRGNAIDLAVAVVVGAAFGTVVTALVRDLLTPVVAAIFGQHDFSALEFTVNGSRFRYGDFLNAVFAFVSIAAAIFFLVVLPVNALLDRARSRPTPSPTTRRCPECLSEVPLAARRCAFCTSPIEPAEGVAPSESG